MTATEIGTMIAQLGFPIFVAVYLMVRMERVLKELLTVMTRVETLLLNALPKPDTKTLTGGKP